MLSKGNQMNRLIKTIACSVAVSTLAGCYTLTVNMDDPDVPKGAIAGHFRTELKVHHVVAGLVTLGDPDIRSEVKKQLEQQDGKYARNLRLIHQHSFIDGLLGGLTGGIYTPTSIILEGDIVK